MTAIHSNGFWCQSSAAVLLPNTPGNGQADVRHEHRACYARAYAAVGGAVSRTRVRVSTSPSSLQVKRTRH